MKKLQLTLLFSLLLSGVFAQATIYGKVMAEGEELVGANVSVYTVDDKALGIGTVTDYDGSYELRLEPGTYNLLVNYLGYSEKWIKKIELKAGEKKELNVVLEGGAELEDVVVSSYSIGSTSAKTLPGSRTKKRLSKRAAGLVSVACTTAASYAPASDMPASYVAETYDEAVVMEDFDGVEMESAALGGHTFAVPLAEHHALEAIAMATNPETDKSPKPKAGQMTAGEQNALNRWDKWLNSLKSDYKNIRENWGFDSENRYAVRVLDDNDNPVADCKVFLKSKAGKTLWEARTSNKGQAELWSNPFGEKEVAAGKIIVEHKGKKFPIKRIKGFKNGVNILRLPYNVYDNPCDVDILFVVDATGSMGDEINYLKAEIEDVIDRTQQNNEALFLRSGSVFYRDEGDDYVTKTSPFSENIAVTDGFIQQQSANGGGNYPEAVHSALEDAVNNFEWSESAIARIMFLVLDAPPHQFPKVLESMQGSIQKAAAAGIRIVPITASGIRQETEFLMKTFAAMTNGTYVFITDHSGIGNSHMAPTDDDYEVEFLNDVMVRLIDEFCKNSSCKDVLQQKNYVEEQTTILNEDKTVSEAISTVKFFPNPADEWLTLQLKETMDEVLVLNLSGQVVLRKIVVPAGETDLDVSALSAGIYIIRFRKGDEVVSGKMVVGRR